MDRKEGTQLANKFRLDAQRMVVLTRVPDSVIPYHEILTAFYQPDQRKHTRETETGGRETYTQGGGVVSNNVSSLVNFN
jgi:hypothetical protein